MNRIFNIGLVTLMIFVAFAGAMQPLSATDTAEAPPATPHGIDMGGVDVRDENEEVAPEVVATESIENPEQPALVELAVEESNAPPTSEEDSIAVSPATESP